MSKFLFVFMDFLVCSEKGGHDQVWLLMSNYVWEGEVVDKWQDKVAGKPSSPTMQLAHVVCLSVLGDAIRQPNMHQKLTWANVINFVSTLSTCHNRCTRIFQCSTNSVSIIFFMEVHQYVSGKESKLSMMTFYSQRKGLPLSTMWLLSRQQMSC